MRLRPLAPLIAAAAVVPAVQLRADEALDARIAAEIAALRADLAALRREREGTGWLDQARAEEIRAAVRDVLADADARTSLADGGATAGFDKGFFVRSADGGFTLKISGYTQFRYSVNHRNDQTQLEQTTNFGFAVARTKIAFTGSVVDPSWTYKLQMQFGGQAGIGEIDDAWIRKAITEALSVRVGQQRFPWLREDEIGETQVLFAERSALNAFFAQGRSNGIRGEWKERGWRALLGYDNGMQIAGERSPTLTVPSPNVTASPVNESLVPPAPQTDWSFSGRFEWKSGGTWEQFEAMSSYRGSEPAVLVGIAGMAQQNRDLATGNGTADAQAFGVTADFVLDLGGFSFNLWGVYRHLADVTNRAGTIEVNDGSVDQWGVQAQIGYFLTDRIELAARYEYGDSGYDSNTAISGGIPVGVTVERVGGGQLLNAVTVGANYRIDRSRLRLTGEVSYVFDTLQDFASASSGYYVDASGSDGQVVVRLQSQLSF